MGFAAAKAPDGVGGGIAGRPRARQAGSGLTTGCGVGAWRPDHNEAMTTTRDDFPWPDTTGFQGAQPLADLAVIEALGPDAASFLHGQLSQDVLHQPANALRLAAYCSAKGRMQATAWVMRPEPDRAWLLTDAGVMPAWLKRLSMFVLRAQVKLRAAEHAAAPWGLAGTQVAQVCPAALALEPRQVCAWAEGLLARLDDVQGVPRWLWVGPSSAAGWLQGLPQLPEGAWAWMEVASAVARVSPATVDQFVPQMVNFEQVGGVNFQKGCYPGQEVVARSQYRGSVKRRAQLALVQDQAQPGQEVFSAADPGQPAGMVVLAAAVPGKPGEHLVLAEIKLDAVANGTLCLGSALGRPLRLAPLPYPILSDEPSR